MPMHKHVAAIELARILDFDVLSIEGDVEVTTRKTRTSLRASLEPGVRPRVIPEGCYTATFHLDSKPWGSAAIVTVSKLTDRYKVSAVVYDYKNDSVLSTPVESVGTGSRVRMSLNENVERVDTFIEDFILSLKLSVPLKPTQYVAIPSGQNSAIRFMVRVGSDRIHPLEDERGTQFIQPVYLADVNANIGVDVRVDWRNRKLFCSAMLPPPLS